MPLKFGCFIIRHLTTCRPSPPPGTAMVHSFKVAKVTTNLETVSLFDKSYGQRLPNAVSAVTTPSQRAYLPVLEIFDLMIVKAVGHRFGLSRYDEGYPHIRVVLPTSYGHRGGKTEDTDKAYATSISKAKSKRPPGRCRPHPPPKESCRRRAKMCSSGIESSIAPRAETKMGVGLLQPRVTAQSGASGKKLGPVGCVSTCYTHGTTPPPYPRNPTCPCNLVHVAPIHAGLCLSMQPHVPTQRRPPT